MDRYLIESDYFVSDGKLIPSVIEHLADARVTHSRLEVRLGNGRGFFILIAQGIAEDVVRAALAGRGEILARSYGELLSSNYRYKEDIFCIRIERRNLQGDRQTDSIPVSQVVAGDKIELDNVIPPVSFMGDANERFMLWPEATSRIQLSQLSVEENVDSNRVLFPVLGLGLDCASSIIQFSNGVSWRAAAAYGPNHPVFRHWNGGNDAPLFTGAFEFDLPDNFNAMHAPEADELTNVRAYFYRIITAISLFSRARPIPLAEIAFRGETTSSSLAPRLGDDQLLEPRGHVNPNASLEVVTKAIRLADKRGRGKLNEAIRRSLDALTHAKFSWDRRIAYVLLWAAVEALGPNERNGIATNLSLVLMGARASRNDPLKQLTELKAAYGVRSKLVHNFSAPTESELGNHGQLTYAYFRDLIAMAAEAADAGKHSPTDFVKQMTARALAGG